MLSLSGTVLNSYYVFNCVLAVIADFGKAGAALDFLLSFISDYLKATIGKPSENDGGQKRKILFVVAAIVLQCSQTALSEAEKQKIISLAVLWVGQPKDKHLWVAITAVYPGEQPPNVSQARQILERWVNKIVLKAAFKKFTDQRRGAFWVRYVDAMDKIIVRANDFKLTEIRNTQGVGRLLEGYVYKEDQNVLLIVMQIGNTVITEVDITGYAMYAHKASEVPPLKNISMDWVGNNAGAHIPLMVKKDGKKLSDFKATGRLIHNSSGGEALTWEHVFNAWLQNQVLPFGFLPDN